MTARIYYLRSAKKNQDGRGDPIACLMSEVDREASAIRYSIAAAHKQDEFSKPIGRKITAGRLEMSPRVLTGVKIPTSGHDISRVIMGDIIQQVDLLTTLSKKDIEEHFANKWFYHIPAKVGAAAKRWMKNANKPKTFQQKTWTAKDLTATTSSSVSLTSHVVPLNIILDGGFLDEGRIGATLSPIAVLVIRRKSSIPSRSSTHQHLVGIDLDKGILLSDPPVPMSEALIQTVAGIMSARRADAAAAQELLKRETLNPSIQGVCIPTIEVQTQNTSVLPPTIPNLPSTKNDHNRTQKPWGDGEYPNGKSNVNANTKPVETPAIINHSKLSDIQQRNYEYFQTQLPSLLKNTFVKGRFVVVAGMQIQRAFPKFADAYNYALGEWAPEEFIIQEVNDQPKNIFHTPTSLLTTDEPGLPLSDQVVKDLIEQGRNSRRAAEAARVVANIDPGLRIR